LLAISGYGRPADLRSVVDDDGRFDDAVARLRAGSHLVAGEFRLSSRSTAVFDAPVEAVLGVGRRVIDEGPDGERRLAEVRLRIERRGERLVTSRVVSVDGEPHIEMVERTRAEVRSLVGVLLLGDAFDRSSHSSVNTLSEPA
jgi:hypothetical protein